MGRKITTARWVPDIPTPDEIDKMIEETGMVEIVPEIQSFNLVPVRVRKRADWEKGLVIASAVTPSAVCMATAETFIKLSPLTYGIFAGISIGWAVIVMMANIKRKNRSRVK